MESPSLPFKVLALGPFIPQGKERDLHRPIRIEPDHLDQVLETLSLSLTISLPGELCQWDHLNLDVKRLKDFHPDSLIESHPFLKNLFEARRFAEASKRKGLTDEEVYQTLKHWPDLPFEIKWSPPTSKEREATSVDRLLAMVAMPGEAPSSSPESQPFTAQIDLLLRQILRQIFLDPDFRSLESTYQGLQLLTRQAKTHKEILFEIVPVSLDTLEETLNHLTPSLIDELPSLILIDLPFDNSSRCLERLEKVAHFSETLLVPTLCWVTPKFLYLDRWEEMGRLPFLPNYIDEPAFAKWRRLKELSASNWVAMLCNRFLIRYPYGPENPSRHLRFDETEYLWISPVWAAGGLILQSLLQTGWPSRFTDWQRIRLTDLATHLIEGDRGISTETNFSDDRIDQLVRIGLTPLVSFLNKDFIFIPKETTAGEASLSRQLFLSRVTRFLFWCKDHFETRLETTVLEEKLKRAFSLFWERSGNLFPLGFEVSAKRSRPDRPPLVKILIEPSNQMLPSGERLELELTW